MKSWWLGASLALVAALAACSGNIGGGSSTLPGGGASPISQVAQPTATPTPLQANSIVTYGDPGIAGPQPLPTIAGYGGTVTLPTPGPSPKGQQPVAIGITAGIVQPTDAPVFDPAAEKRKHNFLAGLAKADKSAPVPLFFIALVATSDVTLHQLPKFAIDVPRDIVLKYRAGTFGLALFDPSKKSKRYDLDVAGIDQASPAPRASMAPVPSPTPSVAPSALPSLRPGQIPSPGATPAPKPSATLPPQRIAFLGTATDLQLVANRPVVFALYAIPVPKPTASPAPKPLAKGHAATEPSPAPSGSPAVLPSPAASGSAAAVTSPEPSPSPVSSSRP